MLWIIPVILVILIVGGIIGWRYYVITNVHTPVEQPEAGLWFEITPEGAVCADGSPLETRMRLGAENKVLVFFYGGGISVDEYTAARPFIGVSMDAEIGFYSPNASDQIPDWCGVGIGDSLPSNPFRDWTIIVIPYTTADFHVGNTDFTYTDMDGNEAVLYHHGYENFRTVMDEAMLYLEGKEQPEELLIAGWSAGGYGAAMLAEDVMEDYFPEAGHVTLCVDSSLLILDNWEEVFTDTWNADPEIIEKIRTENLIVDFMQYLYETYGEDMTFLYIGSVRDGALTKYQTYFDRGVFTADTRGASAYTGYLRIMVRQLQKKVPTIGIYLFQDLPFSIRPNLFMLTQHTILETRTVFWRLTDRLPVIYWLEQAISGNVTTHGLNLIQ